MSRTSILLTLLILTTSLALGATLFGGRKADSWLALGPPLSEDRMSDFPRIILWAWERPEDLSFIDPGEVGVAYLAGTLYLRGEGVVVRPRLQPLRVPPQTKLIAVVRVESDRAAAPPLSGAQHAKAVTAITKLIRPRGIAALQVDFDARTSERDFYRDLLVDVRRQLPASIPLSITALASWCAYDRWLTGLPVDEAVPMLFRMGRDRHQITAYLRAGRGFDQPVCRSSAGVSTDEAFPELPAGQRLYIFHTRPWSPAAARDVIERSKNAH